MEIQAAEFVTSMSAYAPPTPALPQIAVAGKSNVGKSSLINSLCRRKALARTSATPGKTRLINLFLLNNSFSYLFTLLFKLSSDILSDILDLILNTLNVFKILLPEIIDRNRFPFLNFSFFSLHLHLYASII